MPKPRIDEKLLFEAALEEFTEHSYQEASINRIMKNAGISKGSFYYRFENKYQLYLHLLKESSRMKWEFIRNQQPSAEDGVQPPGDIFSLLLYQAELGIRFASMYPKLQKLSKMFSREKGSGVYNDVLKALGGEHESEFEAMIDSAIGKGDFSDSFSREFIINVVEFLFRSYDEIFPVTENSDTRTLMDDMRTFITFLQFGLAGNSVRH